MPSLEESPHPLAFRVRTPRPTWRVPPGKADGLNIRVLSRSLAGMQKEAVVLYGPDGPAWRLVSDEGPYLKGTDLAPFPLAFFTTGLASSYLSTLRKLTARFPDDIRDARVLIHSRYTMAGSALKGTMTGAALPVELEVDGAGEISADLISEASASCPAFQLLRCSVDEAFGLRVNGERVASLAVPAVSGPLEPAPDGFDELKPDPDPAIVSGIIEKRASAPLVSGEGGVGSSLASEQKRLLDLQGIATLRSDGLKQIAIQLFKPVGSSFHFLSDDSPRFGGRGRAPSGLAYAAAAVAFCFMTQLGRYAGIVNRSLPDYRLIQDLTFSSDSGVGPLVTQVSLETPEGDDFGRTLVRMGAQTCFLHAACQSEVPISIKP